MLRERFPRSPTRNSRAVPLLASEFGGRYGLPLGCLLITLGPVFGLLWIGLLLKSLLQYDRLSWLSLALILCLAFLPAFIVFTSLPDLPRLGAVAQFLFYLSLGGLVLVPLSLAREFLKYRRDRPPPSRRRSAPRRRAGDRPNE